MNKSFISHILTTSLQKKIGIYNNFKMWIMLSKTPIIGFLENNAIASFSYFRKGEGIISKQGQGLQFLILTTLYL